MVKKAKNCYDASHWWGLTILNLLCSIFLMSIHMILPTTKFIHSTQAGPQHQPNTKRIRGGLLESRLLVFFLFNFKYIYREQTVMKQ